MTPSGCAPAGSGCTCSRATRARRFYEAAGFVLVEQSEGSGNEEQEPDCTYAWTP